MAQRESDAQRDPIPTVQTRWTPLLRERHSGAVYMRHRLREAVLVVAGTIGLALLLTPQTASVTPVTSSPILASLFRQVEAPDPPLPSHESVPTTAGPALLGTRASPSASPRMPSATPQSTSSTQLAAASPVAPKPSPRRTQPAPRPSATTFAPSSSIVGTATWYCGSGSRCPVGFAGGLYAAISPDLGFLRGRLVSVRYGASVVVVRIVDCNCQATRSIDLFADAFARLMPLSAGKLHGVTLSWQP